MILCYLTLSPLTPKDLLFLYSFVSSLAVISTITQTRNQLICPYHVVLLYPTPTSQDEKFAQSQANAMGLVAILSPLKAKSYIIHSPFCSKIIFEIGSLF
jgi:hypothetical protein